MNSSNFVHSFVSGMNRSASNSPVATPGYNLVTSSVGQWLAGLGLVEYESLFRSNGFDELDFIVSMLSVNLPKQAYIHVQD